MPTQQKITCFVLEQRDFDISDEIIPNQTDFEDKAIFKILV